MVYFSSPTPRRKKILRTSIDDGHRHTWSKRNKFTGFKDGHKHKINLKKMLAEKADGHTHKLLS